MPATYEPIATTTLGSANSNITFSTIPGTYTDLRLTLLGKSTSGEMYPEGLFNSDTGSNYSYTYLRGNGTAASSTRQTNANRFSLSDLAYPDTTYFTFCTLDIFSYAGSTNKTMLTTISLDKNGSGVVQRIVQLWRSTAAITGITLTTGGGGDFAVGTTATLFGIKAA